MARKYARKRSSHVQSDTYWRQSTTPRQATMQRYGIRRGIRWFSRGCHKKWLKYCQKLAPTVLKDPDLHLPKDRRKLCLDWAADELTRTNHPAATEVSLRQDDE